MFDVDTVSVQKEYKPKILCLGYRIISRPWYLSVRARVCPTTRTYKLLYASQRAAGLDRDYEVKV